MDEVDLSDLEDARATAAEFRASFDVFLADWASRNIPNGPEGTPATAGYCKGASQALIAVLRDEYPFVAWRLDGGYGEESVMEDRADMERRASGWVDLDRFPGGMRDAAGPWKGHYWVVGRFGSRDFVFDVTADQFGWDPTTVTEASDPRYLSNLAADRIDRFFTGAERSFGLRASTDWRERVPAAAPGP